MAIILSQSLGRSKRCLLFIEPLINGKKFTNCFFLSISHLHLIFHFMNYDNLHIGCHLTCTLSLSLCRLGTKLLHLSDLNQYQQLGTSKNGHQWTSEPFSLPLEGAA